MIKKLIAVLLLVLATYWSFSSLMPSKISDLNTPETEFSTERALVHLKKISEKPHYPGTEAHTEVRDYIKKELESLGFETHRQEGYSYSPKGRNVTKVQNIVGRIRGKNNSKALLLMSHYDSNPHSSLGASDAGSGVVTILEGLRAYLKSGKTPNNDIIVLISDAEETGLHGANIFVNKHAWSTDVGLVLNFEARGSGGPSYMLIETNHGNKNLIKGFAEANPDFPVANSLAYSIYKMLPNDTDLTRFREDANINGFNFAFIDDHYDYHTALDNYERLDKSSLEHQGTYLMPLLNYFADTNLNQATTFEDHVYFNVPLFKMIHYSYGWILPMLIVSVLVFLLLLYIGFKKHTLSAKEIIRGFAPISSTIIISGALAYFGWQMLLGFYPEYTEILQGFTYNGHTYIWAFSFLSLAIAFLIYSKYYKPRNTGSLLVAPILFWLLLSGYVAFKLQGASFFIIPVIFGLITLAIFIRQRQPNMLLLGLLCFPAILIIAPLVKMLPVGLGLNMLVVSAVIISLLFGLTISVFGFIRNKRNWGFLFLIISAIFFLISHSNSKFDDNNPKPNSLVYLFDANKNEAKWLTYDTTMDPWTSHYLTNQPDETSKDHVINSKYSSGFTFGKSTDVRHLAIPLITKISDTVIGELRHLKYFLSPQRNVNRYELFADKNSEFINFRLNGLPLKSDKDRVAFQNRTRERLVTYFVSEDKYLDLEFSIPANQETTIDIYESSYDLLTNKLFKLKQRENWMIPKPFILNDAIIIKKTLRIE
ncbi:M28 family peptidase [Paucihalobacter sp.]|uniref:M28 family peptidase n=1 Tax=Paucihalobacter sp. TaxID=2850405 RepID=UPI003D161944